MSRRLAQLVRQAIIRLSPSLAAFAVLAVPLAASARCALRWACSNQHSRSCRPRRSTCAHGAYTVSVANAAGSVTHRYSIDDIHALVWHGKVVSRLSPEASRSIAYAINESGRTVVGTLRDARGQHAVRWRDGKAELLDSLLPRDAGWQLITAYAITPDNAIVGIGRHNGTLSAFVLSAPV